MGSNLKDQKMVKELGRKVLELERELNQVKMEMREGDFNQIKQQIQEVLDALEKKSPILEMKKAFYFIAEVEKNLETAN